MPIQGCKNAVEELVVAEATKHINRLAPAIKDQINVDDVAAYVLNRLPPMYATTRRGLTQQLKRANTELSREIFQIIGRAILGVKRDSIKIQIPLPPNELESEERSLFSLQKILGRDNLRWRDLPEAMENALMTVKIKGALLYTHESKVKRSAAGVTDYLKRSNSDNHSADLSWKTKHSKDTSDENAVKQAEAKEFASYMAPASWNFVNTLENLVASVAERQISQLDSGLIQRICLEEVAAYALNRLPAMYATGESGLKYWRDRARTELSAQILAMVREAIITILNSPARFLPPLPSEKFTAEQEIAIAELKTILQIDDIDWRNVAVIVQDVLDQSQKGEVNWVPRHKRNSSGSRA